MSALMKKLKPWEKSTRPVTAEGKKRASLNGNASKLKAPAESPPEPKPKPGPELVIAETEAQRERREYFNFRESFTN